MKLQTLISSSLMIGCACLSMSSCSDDDTPVTTGDDYKYVGQSIGNFDKSEWYPGGELGTTDNVGAKCYDSEAPAVAQQGLSNEFKHGEMFFERDFNGSTKPFAGLGPASVRKSCMDCHPGYGHGKWQNKYTATNGNGYLLVVYHPNDGANSNDGPYNQQVTGMPQTQAASPFLPPIEESGIHISWSEVAAMPSGLPMKFPDGTPYSLQYPVVTIDDDAFHTNPKPTNLAFRLESTIGIIGTGLIDAIDEQDIIDQYKEEAASLKKAGLDVSEYLNPQFWDSSKGDMAEGAFYSFSVAGRLADGSYPTTRPFTQTDGSVKEVPAMLKRYTYALTRATLQDGPGANAIWNITNVTRSDRPKLYTTTAWATAMSEEPSVIAKIRADHTSPYWADTDEKIAEKVKYLLDPSTNQLNNKYGTFAPEMTDNDYYDFMVWHRGLAIPRARNLNDPEVQLGKKVFMQIGCTQCHRPSWNTGKDNYWTSDNIKGKALPRYANQKIYPYSDFVQHKLYMENDIHNSWCRTTPLWGRGLSTINTGRGDRLHDCRARNEIEAIMWHGYSKKSHAYNAAVKFYNLSTRERNAVVKFLQSI